MANECSTRDAGVMEISEVTATARRALEEPLVARGDGALVDAVEQCETVMRVLLAAQLQAIAEIEHRGIASDHGARNTKAWLQQRLRISGSDADARVKVARKVEHRTSTTGQPVPPDLPATAEALRNGVIGLDHARVVVERVRKVTGLLDAQQCHHAEALLVEQSRVLGPREVHTLAERLAYHCDQDGAFRDEERQYEDRELHVAVARDGMTVLKGRLDRETGAKLRAALEPLAAPRPAENGSKDPRTAGQRNADALATVVDVALSTDRLPRAGGQRPHLTVTVPLESLRQRLPWEQSGAAGTIETTGQPLTAAQIRRLACDAEVLPVVLGGEGQPLDVGRAQRTAPPQIRAALLARDGGCAFPGCDHPPGTAEAHHQRHWVDGGHTALSNMVMLCAGHHRIVHAQTWDIDLTNGRPVFIPPTTVDPRRKPRPGNQPLHQLDLTPLITI
jgi:hypothetical protein